MKKAIHVYPDLEEMARGLAERVVLLARDAVVEREIFAFVLTGGEEPKPLYRLLGGEYASQIPWEQTHLFWGDERCVPPDDPNSNFGMAKQLMIDQVPISPENIHRIKGETRPVDQAATDYENELKRVFEAFEIDMFDVMLMGVGEDGHIASLFPQEDALQEKDRWAVRTSAPPGQDVTERISMSLPMLNRTRNTLVLAAGEEKRHVIDALMRNGRSATEDYPALRARAKLHFLVYVDEAAYEPQGVRVSD